MSSSFIPFKTAPRAHQLEEFETSKDMESRALLWAMRSGKSKVMIDTACHQFEDFRIEGVLIFAPNGVHSNWIRRELMKHHWDTIPYKAMAWSTAVGGPITAKKRSRMTKRQLAEAITWQDDFQQLLTFDGLPWFTVNSESIHLDVVKKAIAKFVKKRKRFLFIADESHYFQRPGSKWTRSAMTVSKVATSKRILSGTSVSNSPLQAYSQFNLLQKGALGFNTYADFKNTFAVYEMQRLKSGRSFKALVEYTNLDKLTEAISHWASVKTREDCDLQDLDPSRSYFEVTDRQLKAYRELMEHYRVLEAEEDAIDFIEGGARLIKLQQILSGFLIDEDGKTIDLCPEGNPRLKALEDELDTCEGKTIIWCAFREDVRRVRDRLKGSGHGVVTYQGGMSAREREVALDRFTNDPTITEFVGMPHAGGQGLDLSVAKNIIWYSHVSNLIIKSQADERATATGDGAISLIELAVADSVDEYILDDLLNPKAKRADSVAGNGLKELLARVEL